MDIVKFLTLEKKCDPMLKNCDNNTALHSAVYGGHLQVVSFFIEKMKCPPDIMGHRNRTPLQMAIEGHHPEISQYLHRTSDILTAIAAAAVWKQTRKHL